MFADCECQCHDDECERNTPPQFASVVYFLLDGGAAFRCDVLCPVADETFDTVKDALAVFTDRLHADEFRRRFAVPDSARVAEKGDRREIASWLTSEQERVKYELLVALDPTVDNGHAVASFVMPVHKLCDQPTA